MLTVLLHLLRLFLFLCGGHRQLALENRALRQPLAVYKRTAKRPKLRTSDRLFGAWLSWGWTGWKDSLVLVAPDPVLRWPRRRFRLSWTQRSGRPPAGRPPGSPEIRARVSRMAAANPRWGAPRIHGELLKLGIDGAARPVSRLIPRRCPPPSQTWRTVLTTHSRDLGALEFFPVPSAHWRVLFGLVVLAHPRRRVLPFHVTEHPTATWTAPQIVEACPDDPAPSSLLRERDQSSGASFRPRVQSLRIREGLPAPRRPGQHPFAERLIGSIGREGLDQVLGLSATHLRRILTRDFASYHRARTHLALAKDAPDTRPVASPAWGRIVEIPEVGGLHHRSERQAASANIGQPASYFFSGRRPFLSGVDVIR